MFAGVTSARKSHLGKLFDRVQAVSAERGKKASLARFLGVPPQQLNTWLSEICEPGGETALRMQEWVEAEEAQQQKSPGRAVTQPRRKTRQRKGSNENKSKIRPPEK
jgi:hypothetical protein